MAVKRTKTRAEGGITRAEKAKLEEHAQLWINRIMRTEPINKEKATDAIKRLYAAAGLKEPKIIIVPSPLVGRLAGGLAAAIWHLRKNGKATYAATYAATDAQHWIWDLAKKFTPHAVEFSLGVIKLTWKMQNGGNMWGQYVSFLSAARDVLGLTGLPVWDKFSAYEDAAIEGGWRIMHEKFCMISDFPEILQKDDENRPHNENGPSHRWRDGFEIYHLDGIRLDKEMWIKIMSKTMDFKEIMKIPNTDHRMVAMKYNPEAIINSGAELVDKSERGNELFKIEGKEINKILDFPTVWFLRFQCPTGRVFVEGVDPQVAEATPNADVCQAYALGLEYEEYQTLKNES